MPAGGRIAEGETSIPFECIQCGECCHYLGLVHVIREDLGQYTFVVLNRYTNEETRVAVDPDKYALFDDRSIFAKHPDACPFFRRPPENDKAYCTVHPTRPDICRDYECWRLLILDHRGRCAGRIKFIRTLQSDDPILIRLWEGCIEIHKEPDDAVWEKNMIRILVRAGYSVRK